ncbi:transcription factor bHLH19-like [Carex rostrata]
MAAHLFSDLQIEEPSLFPQWEGDCFNLFTQEEIAVAFGQNQNQELHKSSSCKSNIKIENVAERPKKMAKTTSWESKSGVTEKSSLPTILSFGAGMGPPGFTTKGSAGFYGGVAAGVNQPKGKEEVEMALPLPLPGNNNKRGYDAIAMVGPGPGGEGTRKGTGNQTGSSNKEHVMAERKRRERLCQTFIALSKIVPGLKKMDKATVLGGAIKYLTHLQGKVRDLEAQSAKQSTVESAVIVKKSHLLSDNRDDNADNNSSCTENFHNQGIISDALPEIEAKMTERTVLIKIHCKNRKGALVKVLTEIEALGLSVTSTNVMPFAGSSLDITTTAQVEEEFSMSVKDVVKKLNQAFKQYN